MLSAFWVFGIQSREFSRAFALGCLCFMLCDLIGCINQATILESERMPLMHTTGGGDVRILGLMTWFQTALSVSNSTFGFT